MYDDKRKGGKAVPENIGDFLNELQQEILMVIEKYDWALKFVRRPNDAPPVVVIEDTNGEKIGVLEENGAINYESGIVLREGGE